MTLQNAYGANGIAALFPFSFAIDSADDLEVVVDGVVQASGYSVRGAGGNDGGTVLFDAPPASGSSVLLRHRGRVSITALDGQSGHLADKLVAGDGIALSIAADVDGRQSLTISAIDGSNTVSPDENLGDLTDPAEARTNLDVYSTAQVNAAIAASSDLALKKAQNLADLPDKVVARGNLGVYSTAQVDAAIAQVNTTVTNGSNVTDAVLQRLAVLERNLAVNTLRDQIAIGWSVLKMEDGVADEFEDESGISSAASSGQVYNSAADYYTNGGIMGGNIAPSGTASASAVYNNYHASYANNGDTSDASYWHPNAVPAWWQVTYGTAQSIRKVVLYPYTGQSISGSIQYWDGSAWAESGATFSNATKPTTVYPSTGTSTQWRVYVSGANIVNFSIAEVEMMGIVEPIDITLVSAPFTAQSSPSEARLVLLHQAVNPTVLNIDCTIEVSRDNGVTWTAASLVYEGAFDASSTILSARAELGGQPAGTSMKWRFKTFNHVEQRLHGVWLQWR